MKQSPGIHRILTFLESTGGFLKKKGKESFSKSLKKTISKVAWLIISLTTLTPYDSVHFWDEKKQIYFLI